MSLGRYMRGLARFQHTYHLQIVLIAAIITVFMLQGLGNVRMESDFTKSMPQDIPAIANEREVNDRFGGEDLVLVVIEIDHGSDILDRPRDIRDPRVMELLVALQTQLESETKIDEVVSAGLFFERGIPRSLEGVKTALASIPGSEGFFSKDYSVTLLYLYANVGSGEKAVTSFTELVQDNIDSVAKPPGIEITITGGPPISNTILQILWSDAVYTTSLAAGIILLLLILLQRSIYRGILVFIPLSLGLIWTLGTMGHLDIPLSIATVAVGAMVLGLGVEYGIFVVERYMEERDDKGKSQLDSLLVTVPSVGASILGSGITTIVGFGALGFSSFPLLQDLGNTLALGIASCLAVALLVNPAFIVLAGRATHHGECKDD